MARADPFGRYLALGAVMRTEWVDPDDIKPTAAKTARKITGYRAYCPLRRMMALPGSDITAAHIMAADKLREAWDIGRLGMTPGREPAALFVALVPQPRTGPGAGDLKQAKAAREVHRAMLLFGLPAQALIVCVILQNQSLRAWCQGFEGVSGGLTLNPKTEKQKLMVILDRLAEHFDAEIDNEVARGRRLVP
jgi:hypothetical protein